jgi:hypothetical protein
VGAGSFCGSWMFQTSPDSNLACWALQVFSEQKWQRLKKENTEGKEKLERKEKR